VRQRLYNDRTIALIRTLAQEGKSAPQIAEHIGSTAGSVRVLASRLGIRFRLRVFNEANIALMRTMADDGKTAVEIAEKIGSTAGSVRVLASRLGIRFRPNTQQGVPTVVQLTVVLPRSVGIELTNLAKRVGLRSASVLARQYLEELVRSADGRLCLPASTPHARGAVTSLTEAHAKGLNTIKSSGAKNAS
jgi:hypothetical protein